MRKLVSRFMNNEEGAALVEYGMLVGLIACVCILGVTTVGADVEAVFIAIGGVLTPLAATIAG